MISGIENLEDDSLIACHVAEIVKAVPLAPLGQVAGADELVRNILELVHVVERYGARVTDAKRPLLDGTTYRAPDAKERGQSCFSVQNSTRSVRRRGKKALVSLT